ncbi:MULTISPECIES: peptide chain release factor N(5)-glutamine methyltransferase [unclassified Leeuwenhoekiella]|uniref:peptide chain release factor N(5)-glutamine methyltransferase n=1 Tax=unclassified Leeuwenhoekiella TaxID=2615029 RepID=UPI000C6B6658|nr:MULTISPECIES: peptide chain release factor N(5)-glutamine methyltransferase [unclassified Leeuwenhoekiella]MAW94625.1 protein-(glutamine-N5) methyltransferase, release factor-specific [Leeuwenhoekiella sp.]MBA82048.1 protein-(glutamine-N5) methyltransferase, release factor-specific [Leeuwenhoekiella sp.]|tara:strand:- start:10621 stop:11466 length:846 start_codon:yes stop_codon:yes gene_type:complete
MTLKEFKEHFFKRLSPLYPAQELESFFRILMETYLGLSSIDVHLNPDKKIKLKKLDHLLAALERLVHFEPLQYILGQTEFYGLHFTLNPNVLIPRPETEELVEWILKDTDAGAHFNILDIGTGSGCIAVSLAKYLPLASVAALDVSEDALTLSAHNAELNNAEVHFLQQNILETKALQKSYDIIVSNPPYVRNLEKTEIEVNVLDYEPHLALFVEDHDALIFYRKIAELAKGALSPKGRLYVEINQYLAEETQVLFKEFGFNEVELRNDFAGKPRMIKASL